MTALEQQEAEFECTECDGLFNTFDQLASHKEITGHGCYKVKEL